MAVPTVVIETHGLNAVLQPFVQDLSKLSTKGIAVTINGCQRSFKRALLAFLADNLASNAFGGFQLYFLCHLDTAELAWYPERMLHQAMMHLLLSFGQLLITCTTAL